MDTVHKKQTGPPVGICSSSSFDVARPTPKAGLIEGSILTTPGVPVHRELPPNPRVGLVSEDTIRLTSKLLLLLFFPPAPVETVPAAASGARVLLLSLTYTWAILDVQDLGPQTPRRAEESARAGRSNNKFFPGQDFAHALRRRQCFRLRPVVFS